MKKLNVLSLFLGILVGAIVILLMASCSDEEFNPERTRQFTIGSPSVGARYTIKIGLPEHYKVVSRGLKKILLDLPRVYISGP